MLTVVVIALLLTSSDVICAFQLPRYHDGVLLQKNNVDNLMLLHSTTIPPSKSKNKNPFEGQPSDPWKRQREKQEQLDGLADWAVASEANRPVVCEYDPDGLWLWRQYKGTVVSITIIPVLVTMTLGVGIDYMAHTFATTSWPILGVPPKNDPFIQQLEGLNTLWEHQLQLCTLILTFFTSQSYNHWKTVYLTTRAIQGRINDICLLLSISASREEEEEGSSNNGYTKEAAILVKTCTRLIRMSHSFFWAVIPGCSNEVGAENKFGDFVRFVKGELARKKEEKLSATKDDDDDNAKEVDNDDDDGDIIGAMLLSPEGLEYLYADGQLSREEVDSLLDTKLPPSQYPYVLLEWVGLYVKQGLKDGTLEEYNGFEENILRQLSLLRGEYFNIGDYAAGRMPLAYVHLVQVLVDTLVYLAPFSLYGELGTLSIPAAALLTLFFKGLLRLSKSFLDPFGDEGFPGQNIRVDVLVSELNFGAGSRWVRAGEVLPPLNNNNIKR